MNKWMNEWQWRGDSTLWLSCLHATSPSFFAHVDFKNKRIPREGEEAVKKKKGVSFRDHPLFFILKWKVLKFSFKAFVNYKALFIKFLMCARPGTWCTVYTLSADTQDNTRQDAHSHHLRNVKTRELKYIAQSQDLNTDLPNSKATLFDSMILVLNTYFISS